jgi:pyochelin synthetase
MNNQSFHVLGSSLESKMEWVTGELYIGGSGLAKGYWNDEEKTRASFIIHPLTGKRLYKTGDLGRYLPDGNIEFLGREDYQVKIRGHRIELGEIESVLTKHPGIHMGVVSVTGDNSLEKQLTGYLVLDPEQAASTLYDNKEVSGGIIDWDAIVTTGSHVMKEADIPGIDEEFNAVWNALEHIYEAAVYNTFEESGVFSLPGKSFSINDCMQKTRIKSRFKKWLKRNLDLLSEKGFIEGQKDKYKPLPKENTQELFHALLQSYNSALETYEKKLIKNGFDPAWAHLTTGDIMNISRQLSDIITDQMDITHNIMQKSSKILDYIYSVIIRLIDSLSFSGDRPLSILELGTGDNTIASSLLASIPPEKIRYDYTNISNYIINSIKEDLKLYSSIRCGVLDIEQDPGDQGYMSHSYDLIISTLHISHTYKIHESLDNLSQLLAPGGILIIVEQTTMHQIYDVEMVRRLSFDRYEDEELRKDHSLLSFETWKKVLHEHHFTDIIRFNKENTILDFWGLTMIMAKGPSTVSQFSGKKLRDYLSKELPDYMIPPEYVLLKTIPLTINGKVDRKNLPHPEHLNIRSGTTHVAPRTTIEEKLVQIWAEVLGMEMSRISVHDNFFDLGGHSLIATQIRSRIFEIFHVDIPMNVLFETPDVAGFAKGLETILWNEKSRISPDEKRVGEDREDIIL